MARANTRTILPLDRFAANIGIHPIHFNQVYLDILDSSQSEELAPANLCGQPLVQYGWMRANMIGREEIAQAILEAETQIREQLGYNIAPAWTRNERVVTPRSSYGPEFFSFGQGLRGPVGVQVKNGYLLSGGVEATSLVAAAAPVVYTDVDNDGYKETATITVNTTLTEPQELAVFYPGHSGDFAWEIRPLQNISISAGVAVLTCRREQLVLEALLESLTPRGVDGTDDAKFLANVDVYRHYNDPSTQVRYLWTVPGAGMWDGWCNCGLAGCVTCQQDTQFGCLNIRLSRQGVFNISPGVWNAGTGVFDGAMWTNCRAPDNADVYYYSGWRYPSAKFPLLQIDPLWERVVSFLALSLLDRPMCACESLQGYMQHWRDDLAAVVSTPSGGSETYRLTTGQLANPLGTTRAAMHAWQHVARHRIGESAGV